MGAPGCIPERGNVGASTSKNSFLKLLRYSGMRPDAPGWGRNQERDTRGYMFWFRAHPGTKETRNAEPDLIAVHPFRPRPGVLRDAPKNAIKSKEPISYPHYLREVGLIKSKMPISYPTTSEKSDL